MSKLKLDQIQNSTIQNSIQSVTNMPSLPLTLTLLLLIQKHNQDFRPEASWSHDFGIPFNHCQDNSSTHNICRISFRWNCTKIRVIKRAWSKSSFNGVQDTPACQITCHSWICYTENGQKPLRIDRQLITCVMASWLDGWTDKMTSDGVGNEQM